MTLVLIGYMGSGKSTIGRKLSKILNYEFIDFDIYIENNIGMKIHEIFKTKGEVFFRKQERLSLGQVVKRKHAVIALGGGTPCYGDNLKLIKQEKQVVLIYLKSSINNLVDRLFDEKSGRPLISHLESKDELLEFIGKHLFERAPVYEQSDITIKTDGLSVDDVVKSILLQLF